MAENDSVAVGVGLQQAVAPAQLRRVRTGVVFEVQGNEVQTACAEQVEVIVIGGSIMAAVIRPSREVGDTEELVVEGGGAGGERPGAGNGAFVRFLCVHEE